MSSLLPAASIRGAGPNSRRVDTRTVAVIPPTLGTVLHRRGAFSGPTVFCARRRIQRPIRQVALFAGLYAVRMRRAYNSVSGQKLSFNSGAGRTSSRGAGGIHGHLLDGQRQDSNLNTFSRDV